MHVHPPLLSHESEKSVGVASRPALPASAAAAAAESAREERRKPEKDLRPAPLPPSEDPPPPTVLKVGWGRALQRQPPPPEWPLQMRALPQRAEEEDEGEEGAQDGDVAVGLAESKLQEDQPFFSAKTSPISE